MNIKLPQIKASPKPIRTTWDEDKLNELAQSIQEQGLIVPIKVRPTDNEHYEIVYGHRRLEACRRAGLAEVEAIVEGVDDTNALIQALIENVQREDMEPQDTGKALIDIQEKTGWTLIEMGRRGIFNYDRARELVAYYQEKEKGINVVHAQQGSGVRQVLEIKRALGDDIESKKSVAEKVSKEGLTYLQTKQVAESIAATQDPAMRQRLIEAPYTPYTHDPEYAKERAERYGAHDPMARDKSPAADEAWRLTAEVVMLVDFIRAANKMSEEAIRMNDLGKFAPEARPFIARKLKTMVSNFQAVIDRLEE